MTVDNSPNLVAGLPFQVGVDCAIARYALPLVTQITSPSPGLLALPFLAGTFLCLPPHLWYWLACHKFGRCVPRPSVAHWMVLACLPPWVSGLRAVLVNLGVG